MTESDQFDLSPHMENYLKSIALLAKKNKVVRVKDISEDLQVSTPSVSSALDVLTEAGLVEHEKYSYVDFTEQGQQVANSIQKRYELFLELLIDILKIDPQIAEQDACELEHAVSKETLEKLGSFVEFVKSCPNSARPHWLQGFDHYYKTGKRPPEILEDCKFSQDIESS